MLNNTQYATGSSNIILKIGVFLLLFLFVHVSAHASNIQQKISFARDIYFENPDTSYIICSDLHKRAERLSENQQIEVLICLARYELLKNDFTTAAERLNNAIQLALQSNDETLLARSYHLKAILQGKLDNYQEEINLLEKAYNIHKNRNDSSGMRFELSVMFTSYFSTQDTVGMRNTLNKIQKFKHLIKGTDRYFYWQNMGMYQLSMDYNNKAVQYFKKALVVAMMEDMIDSKATILMYLGKAFGRLKDCQKGLDYIENSILVSQQNELVHEWIEALEAGMIIAENCNRFQLAFNYNQTYDSLKQVVYDLERINHIHYAEKKLDLAEKEKEISKQKLLVKNEELKTKATQTKLRITLYGVIILTILIFLVLFFLMKMRALNRKVKKQKDAIEDQNHLIQSTLDQVNESLRYSERLQKSLLPSNTQLSKQLRNYFVYYRPKDIVSGDFYWTTQVNGHSFFAVADCTGHGIPGAMVSMVCINALNTAVKSKKLFDPSKILEFCSEQVKQTFNESAQFSIMDGMDIALISYQKTNQDKTTVYFSGAHNPVWVKRTQGENLKVDHISITPEISHHNIHLYEVKGVKRPVGNSPIQKPFKTHELEILKDDVIYLFSDGYADQFGSEGHESPQKPGGKKFKYKRLKYLLVQDSGLENQEEKLNNSLETWMGEFEQIDDICVTGIQI